MKKTFFLFLFALLFTSCSSTYYLSRVKTTSQDISQSKNGEFIIENDSLFISYNFYGADGPIRITIHNKTNIPLYIDWERSALVIDNTAISYRGTATKIRGSINGSSYSSNDAYDQLVYDITGYSYSTRNYVGELNGSVDIPKTISFIPPKSRITEIPLIMNVTFDNISKTEFRNATIGNKYEEVLHIKRADYSIDNSPLVFKSYLTVFFQDEKPFVYEDEFYLSSLLKSSRLSPKNLPNSLENRGDLFYVEKYPNTTALDIILTTTVVVGATAIGIWATPNNSYK